MYKIKSLRKSYFEIVFIFFLLMGILIYPSISFKGAYSSLLLCGNVLIPSLFPFMFLSCFTIKSKISKYAEKIFGPIARILFKLPKSTGLAIFFSLIGGYPVGAKSIITLYENNVIDKKTAEKMVYFCFCGGPAFIIGTIGCTLNNNYFLGLAIFISQVISTIILGIVLNLKEKYIASKKETTLASINFTNNFISSCNEASSAIFVMCFLVIIFGSILALCQNILSHVNINNSIITSTLFSLIEICNGIFNTIKSPVPYELLGFFIGFGGLCVHMQIFAITDKLHINKIKYFICRFFQGTLTGFFTFLILRFFPITSMALNSTPKIKISANNSIISGISIILMTFVFLFSINQEKNSCINKKIF